MKKCYIEKVGLPVHRAESKNLKNGHHACERNWLNAPFLPFYIEPREKLETVATTPMEKTG
jgi:hypothetical protein